MGHRAPETLSDPVDSILAESIRNLKWNDHFNVSLADLPERLDPETFRELIRKVQRGDSCGGLDLDLWSSHVDFSWKGRT